MYPWNFTKLLFMFLVFGLTVNCSGNSTDTVADVPEEQKKDIEKCLDLVNEQGTCLYKVIENEDQKQAWRNVKSNPCNI